MVAGSCTGSGRSALASTSLPCRSLREASGEAEEGETNAQMNAIGHSNPGVANPSHPATLMAAACGCARWRASRPGNCPKKTMMTVATVMSTANTKKSNRVEDVEGRSHGGGSVHRDSRIESRLVPRKQCEPGKARADYQSTTDQIAGGDFC